MDTAERIVFATILYEKTPLDVVKSILSKFPEDDLFRKKCEMVVAVREGRAVDAICIAMMANVGYGQPNPMSPFGFEAEQMELSPTQEPIDREKIRNYLTNSDRAYILKEFKKNNEKLNMDKKREIANHLGVIVVKVKDHVHHLKQYPKRLEQLRARAAEVKKTSRRLTASDRDYILQEYLKNDRRVSFDEKKRIAEHLKVHVVKIQRRVDSLKGLENRRKQAGKGNDGFLLTVP